MPLVSILAVACLLSAPASGAVLLPQDTPAASSAQSPASAPAETTQTAPTKSEPPAAKQGASNRAAKKKTEGASASRTAKRHKVRRGAPKPTGAGEPRRVVVREGGAIEPTAKIAPGLTPQEADQQRQKTEELLSLTEESLKRLAGRTLDSPRQETVTQIHNYVDGAHSALKDGDTQRAHTLALKAHLLADDLLKH
jgi:hypothetical protein